MNPTLSLRDATMQDIQLELIRRRRFNDFDGERICQLLLDHRSLWTAVLLDRLGQLHFEKPGNIPMGGLIKLRDLADNFWNTDSLFVLTHTPAQAKVLEAAFEESGTGAMPRVIDNLEESDMALGMGRQVYGLLKVWWD